LGMPSKPYAFLILSRVTVTIDRIRIGNLDLLTTYRS
jgi:hypothetical protein